MAVNMVSAIGRKSITNDEVVHIPRGYFYLTERNFRLNAEHPPLAKLWSSFPDAESPRNVGAGEDFRLLGINVQWIEVD